MSIPNIEVAPFLSLNSNPNIDDNVLAGSSHIHQKLFIADRASRASTRLDRRVSHNFCEESVVRYRTNRHSPQRRIYRAILHEGTSPTSNLICSNLYTLDIRQTKLGDLGGKMMEGAYHSERAFHTYLPDNVPKPHAWGSYKSDPSTWFYLCDFRDMVEEVPKTRHFVSLIAKVHRESMGKNERFGFDVPTYLACVPNDNTWQTSWEVWFSQAMKQMFRIEEMAHGKDDELDILKKDIFEKVIPRLLRPLETGGRSIKPCLIHSDLWPGNTMPDAQTHEILIFDSCAYWGHNEADLGTWRAPRYKMGRAFLEEHQKVMGISEPKDDWADRNALYALRYDLLVSTLFPGTEHGLSFRRMAKCEMARLVKKHSGGLDGFEEGASSASPS